MCCLLDFLLKTKKELVGAVAVEGILGSSDHNMDPKGSEKTK